MVLSFIIDCYLKSFRKVLIRLQRSEIEKSLISFKGKRIEIRILFEILAKPSSSL